MLKKVITTVFFILTVFSCNSAFAATFDASLLEDFYTNNKAFLLFNISDLVVSVDDAVTAVLKLYQVSESKNHNKTNNYNVGIYQVDSNLLSKINVGILNNLKLDSSDLIGSFQGTLTNDSEWLSAAISLSNEEWLNLINSGGTLAIVLKTEDKFSGFPNFYFSGVKNCGNNNNYAPSLSITTTTIPNPEPSSLILILAGSISLLIKIRKKVFVV